MKINLNNNNRYNQSFGMAFRKPITTEAQKALIEFSAIGKNSTARKGMEQLIKEQAKLKHFDLEFLPTECGGVINVIDNASNKIVTNYEGTSAITGVFHFGAVEYPGKKLITALFNPKKHLPQNFLLAADKAKMLEKEAVEAARNQEKLNKIFLSLK